MSCGFNMTAKLVRDPRGTSFHLKGRSERTPFMELFLVYQNTVRRGLDGGFEEKTNTACVEIFIPHLLKYCANLRRGDIVQVSGNVIGRFDKYDNLHYRLRGTDVSLIYSFVLPKDSKLRNASNNPLHLQQQIDSLQRVLREQERLIEGFKSGKIPVHPRQRRGAVQ